MEIVLSLFYLSPDTKSKVQTHTFCTTQVDKNRQNRMLYNGIGAESQGLQTLSLQNVFQNNNNNNHL